MKKGITTNVLKVIAVILMLVDHIGMYLYREMSEDTYFILRSIGRMSMPIFVYLIVQSFFYTKNLKKYIFRILILAIITQVFLLILGYLNQTYYPHYWTGVNNYLGVVFSYTMSLILLTVIDRKTIFKKLSYNQNLIIRINIFILIALAYLKCKIEFDMRVPFIFLEIFAIEKLFMKDGILIKRNSKEKIIKKVLYILSILACFALSLIYVTYSPGNKYAMLAAILFIILYNGEKEKDNLFIKYIFYFIFPLQHIVLYLLAML